MPFEQLFTDPALQPIRTTSSGGWISYWPIPYAKSCKVVVENAPGFYYHVTYQTYRPGRKVETYTKDLTPVAKSELEAALKVWRDPSQNRPTAAESALGRSPKARRAVASASVPPGGTSVLLATEGPACIDRRHGAAARRHTGLLGR
jgi:hypothetical protein